MAQEWLDAHGYKYELLDVERDRTLFQKMMELSGQRLTPTLVVDGTKILPDFGPDELEPCLKRHNIAP